MADVGASAVRVRSSWSDIMEEAERPMAIDIWQRVEDEASARLREAPGTER
jgi:hypothetical protein